jgi:hypothetical protein
MFPDIGVQGLSLRHRKIWRVAEALKTTDFLRALSISFPENS